MLVEDFCSQIFLNTGKTRGYNFIFVWLRSKFGFICVHQSDCSVYSRWMKSEGAFPHHLLTPPPPPSSHTHTHTHRHMHKLREWREKRATPPHSSSLLFLHSQRKLWAPSWMDSISPSQNLFTVVVDENWRSPLITVWFFFFFFLFLLLRNLAAETLLCRHELLYLCQTWWVSRAPVCGVVDDWFREELRKRRRTP